MRTVAAQQKTGHKLRASPTVEKCWVKITVLNQLPQQPSSSSGKQDRKNPQVVKDTQNTSRQSDNRFFIKKTTDNGLGWEKAVQTTCALALTSVHWMHLI